MLQIEFDVNNVTFDEDEFFDVMRELVVVQGARLLVSSGQVTTLELGVSKMETVLDNGEALERFRRMIIRQVTLKQYQQISRS